MAENNLCGQVTGRVKTQTELIETEILKLVDTMHVSDQTGGYIPLELDKEDLKKLAALVLQHRHDVYFRAYRDGLVQGRKEQAAVGVTRFNQFYMLMQVSLVNSGVTMSEAKRILNEIKRRIDLTDEEWEAEGAND